MKKIALILFMSALCSGSFALVQGDEGKNQRKTQDYQIHFTQPVKEIHHIMYDKNFLPIQGEISEDKKSVVLKNWEKNTKVRVKVTYEDGSQEEIVRSPCYIDPVVL